jgi:hypothetical protein
MLAMNIRYITCSDLREDVPHSAAIDLLNLSDKAELGIQAHQPAMFRGNPRHEWMSELLRMSAEMDVPLNIAVHVNYKWCAEFCRGNIAPELQDWIYMKNKNTNGPVVKRWQLNIGDRTAVYDADRLARVISDFPDREFIFPYNPKPAVIDAVARLNRTGVKFSLLYDSSYGYGIAPESWAPPVYENHPQGYAGGLCGENISENLDKISAMVPRDYAIWVDAEGKLMKPGTREFDVARAKAYVMNALNWPGKNNGK